ncbi:hypothetical protein [Nonomuraea maheshkhaliensis]|uniref:hypothetical protein n=1 Tax=Nonomuraea maheshkhaliensis TaxID=419590 RepID=UPI0031F968F5
MSASPTTRPAHLLSERLGVPCLELPGGHVPYLRQSEDFSATLTKILDGFPS